MTDEHQTLLELLTRRHSCRAFDAREVPQATIEQIVTTAGRTPSWCNAQPWSVLITRGAETGRFRDMLTETAATKPASPDFAWPASYSGPYQARRREVGWQLYEAVGVAKGDREGSARQAMQNFTLFGAPHVAIIHCPDELGPYGAVDCGGFVTAFTLAAEALGVASIPQAAVAAYGEDIRNHFALPETCRIVCAISFGYRDEDHPANSFRTDRAPLDEILDVRS